MGQYSAGQIREFLVEPELQGEQGVPFYRRRVLNYRGDDHGWPYSEIIANWMIDSDDNGKLDGVIRDSSELQQERPEFADGSPIHTLADAEKPASPESSRLEEAIAKRLFVLENDPAIERDVFPGGVYRVVDYQVPVNRVNGSTDGKVDLIAQGDDETLLVELKRHDSDETLLRAMVEAYTYWLLVNDTKRDGEGDDSGAQTAYHRFVSNYGNADLWPAVMIFPGTQAWEDYEDTAEGNRPYLRKLLHRWNVRVFKVEFDGLEEGSSSVDVSKASFRVELMPEV